MKRAWGLGLVAGWSLACGGLSADPEAWLRQAAREELVQRCAGQRVEGVPPEAQARACTCAADELVGRTKDIAKLADDLARITPEEVARVVQGCLRRTR